MKTVKLIPILLTAFIFCSFNAVAQEDEIIEIVEIEDETNLDTIDGIYLGMEGGYYTFSFEEDGDENILTFDKISPEVSKTFDLSNKTHIGQKFSVTYITQNVVEDDDEDMLMSEKTIITLKQL